MSVYGVASCHQLPDCLRSVLTAGPLCRQVYENEVCVSAARCQFCDEEGHRFGDTWKPNNCTSCECREGGALHCLHVSQLSPARSRP